MVRLWQCSVCRYAQNREGWTWCYGCHLQPPKIKRWPVDSPSKKQGKERRRDWRAWDEASLSEGPSQSSRKDVALPVAASQPMDSDDGLPDDLNRQISQKAKELELLKSIEGTEEAQAKHEAAIAALQKQRDAGKTPTQLLNRFNGRIKTVTGQIEKATAGLASLDERLAALQAERAAASRKLAEHRKLLAELEAERASVAAQAAPAPVPKQPILDIGVILASLQGIMASIPDNYLQQKTAVRTAGQALEFLLQTKPELLPKPHAAQRDDEDLLGDGSDDGTGDKGERSDLWLLTPPGTLEGQDPPPPAEPAAPTPFGVSLRPVDPAVGGGPPPSGARVSGVAGASGRERSPRRQAPPT